MLCICLDALEVPRLCVHFMSHAIVFIIFLFYIYIYIYRERERERESWVQVTLNITLRILNYLIVCYRIQILKISQLDYMFFMFLICMLHTNQILFII